MASDFENYLDSDQAREDCERWVRGNALYVSEMPQVRATWEVSDDAMFCLRDYQRRNQWADHD